MWSRYQDKIKSCFSKNFCSVFDATTETDPSKVSWTNKFICPFTKKKMKIAMSNGFNAIGIEYKPIDIEDANRKIN